MFLWKISIFVNIASQCQVSSASRQMSSVHSVIQDSSRGRMLDESQNFNNFDPVAGKGWKRIWENEIYVLYVEIFYY